MTNAQQAREIACEEINQPAGWCVNEFHTEPCDRLVAAIAAALDAKDQHYLKRLGGNSLGEVRELLERLVEACLDYSKRGQTVWCGKPADEHGGQEDDFSWEPEPETETNLLIALEKLRKLDWRAAVHTSPPGHYQALVEALELAGEWIAAVEVSGPMPGVGDSHSAVLKVIAVALAALKETQK